MSSLEARRITTNFLGLVTNSDESEFSHMPEFLFLECDCGQRHDIVGDDVDGVSSTVLNGIKAILFHMLGVALFRVQKENCEGCLINHPSQRQHECLITPGEYFYRRNFENLMKKLYTPNFIPAVRYFLTVNKLELDKDRLVRVIVRILKDLKFEEDIYNTIEAVVTPPDLSETHFEYALKIWEGTEKAWETS